MPQLLIIDDDQRLADMLRAWLGARGFEVHHRPDARGGLATATEGKFDAVILDVMLPDGDGFSVCRELRARSEVPILMLTARGEELDRIVGLELGADDYLPKPFNPRELEARLKAILRRRPSAPKAGPLRYGRLSIDLNAHELRVDGELRRLTSHQFSLLAALVRAEGRVLSREQLLEELGLEEDAFDRAIDVHISRIRTAVEDDPHKPRWIRTIRGVGYSFTPSEGD